MINFGTYVELGPHQTYLKIADQHSSKTILYSSLIKEFIIDTANKHTAWKYPAMITDTWQCVKIEIDLASFENLLVKKFEETALKIELMLFKKSWKSGKVRTFENYTIKKNEAVVDSREQKLVFSSKFQFKKGSTSIALDKTFLLGLKINGFTITYLATDIFVASNHNQIKPPFKISKKMKEILRNNTYWFNRVEHNEPEKKVTKKREQPDSDETKGTENDLHSTDEHETKKAALEIAEDPITPLAFDEKDWFVFELFPEVYRYIDGTPMLSFDKYSCK